MENKKIIRQSKSGAVQIVRPARTPARRGVLLLVVLSMLVLFMLIGTAFLMSSSQEQKTAKNLAKVDSKGNNATKLLDGALLQILRDTNNPYSVVRYHSLLRDLYGTGGLEGVIYSPPVGTDPKTADGQLTSFAGADPTTATVQFGSTNGQFIDIYVRALNWDNASSTSANDPFTPEDESRAPAKLTQPDPRHVIKLDRNALGVTQIYPMPVTKGYFNGQLLTITSGAAAGQSTRILEYDYIADIKPTSTKPTDATYLPTRLFRFRVMAFQRSDGQALQQVRRPPEIDELAGQSFMVNGRAFSGTGVGYNPLAAAGQPRLSAVQTFSVGGNTFGVEIGLLPNSVPMQLNNVSSYQPNTGTDPFLEGTIVDSSTSKPKGTFVPINNPAGSPLLWLYQSFVGPGDANESYDAADFQNMFLALLTVTPRAQGRVVQNSGGTPTTLSIDDPTVSPKDFLRLDLEDLPMPSFHRPDLINFWYHRILNSQWLSNGKTPTDENVRAIFQPYDTNGNPQHGLSAQQASLITAIKRQSSLRPLFEDHPHFDPGNRQSALTTRLSQSNLVAGTNTIAIPYWEAVGPWDVDNDNDGIPDSVWVDLGDPVQEAEDGTRYKPLYAFLIVDLDSRLNVNAHGLADHIVTPLQDLDNNDKTRDPFFDPSSQLRGWPGNLAHDTTNANPAANTVHSSLKLPRGIGYGPAEISLRPVFPSPQLNEGQLWANRDENVGPIDSYATLLFGRNKLDGSTVNGKYGYAPNLNYPRQSIGDAATAGSNYHYARRRPNWFDDPATVADSPLWFTGEQASPSLLAQLKFFDHPWSSIQWKDSQSGFGTLPDLKGRYALGLDYFGQPVNEGAADVNPNMQQQPFNLLAKSPYELDLSSTQRRDDLSTGASSSIPDKGTEFTQTVETLNGSAQAILGKNDDAAFSPTDLEKVLRAWDVDSGALPSRLWDAVDAFDPVKLIRFDPNDSANFASNLLNQTVGLPTGNKSPSAELMAGAQQLASVNRRLVTTDSFDLPVISSTVPNQATLAFGPDGAPGRAKADGTIDLTQLGAAGSDDFKAVMGKDPAQATIVDLLQYRVWTEARRFEMRRQSLTEGGVANLNASDYGKFMAAVNARFALINLASPNLVSDLLAPEVIAGKKMDLNRPFGDGLDNNGDGVVDDPLEAGDPFLDLNGNGHWDVGEPFIDLLGTGSYVGAGDPRCDQIWSNLSKNGTLAEPIYFDYTNGHEEPLNVVLSNAIKSLGGVRNLESQGRQLFARHLYCLMLLLTDDNYIAPWDENDPQLLAWMDAEKAKLTATTITPVMTAAEADFIVKRKATCKMIAQWAVNCVDMRDPDVISTPFEYDENPWDGWGVWNDKWKEDVSTLTLASTAAELGTKPSFIPLDGDPATDENKAEVIDWANVSKNTATTGTNINQKKIAVLQNSSGTAIVTHPLNQTRGIVWGAERPELLITETLAFHDRRTEDLLSPHGHAQLERAGSPTPGPDNYVDTDLDQGLRPQGSAFVELYNPWSPSGQLPAELYSHLDISTGYKYNPNETKLGVILDRLSNYAWDDAKGQLTTLPTNAANKIKRSPVWRLIVVEEWPNAKNVGDKLPANRTDISLPTGNKIPNAYNNVATAFAGWRNTAGVALPKWVPTNPDFDPLFESDMRQQIAFSGDTQQTYMVGPAYKPAPGALGVPKQNGTKNQFYVAYPYVEREIYFTTDKSPAPMNTDMGAYQYDLSKNRVNFNLRIPDRSIKLSGTGATATTLPNAQTQKFISPTLELSQPKLPVIAPVMPGRYAVVGSAGTNYEADPRGPADATNATSPFNPKNQIYTTTIGRQQNSGPANSQDTAHEKSVHAHAVRHIQMYPSPNLLTTPSTITGRIEAANQQLLVGANGGDPKDQVHKGNTFDPFSVEIARDNELINDNGTVKNIELTKNAAGVISASANYYPPCVTVPIDGMSVSEPPWGYTMREQEAAAEEQPLRIDKQLPDLHFRKDNDHKEGRYFRAQTTNADSFDKPFDTDPVLVRTGTTANYRVIHLQRLANPLLPWNPPRLLADGTVNPEHKDNAPINPYLTVDSASVNLTTFNGTSDAEHDLDTTTQEKQGKIDPGNLADVGKYLTNFNNSTQVFDFRSQERGFAARLNWDGSNPPANTAVTSGPQRVLWAQEPANLVLQRIKSGATLLEMVDLIGGREMSRRYLDEVPDGTQNASGQPTDNLKKDINPLGGNNYINMVLKHSLGYGNESYGLLYDAIPNGAKQANAPAGSTGSKAPVGSAIGAPAPSRFVFMHNVDTSSGNVTGNPAVVTSTDPWVHWGNRPFVSADELLNVPMASQATMLRQYSTIDPNVLPANRPNPYGLAELGMKYGPLPVNASRFAVMQSSFGQMANMLAATALPYPIPPNPTLAYVQGVADVVRDPATGVPVPDAKGNVQPYGAPNFYRILDFVQVPSRFVGTDTMLNAETFNDVPNVNDSVNTVGTAVGSDITGADDPRYNFQPPFNKVSRERDPGKVNLNTVTGRRVQTSSTSTAQIWSEVYDGIMHRIHDANPSASQLSESGPAWRDVVLSRRGYRQIDAAGAPVDKSASTNIPDTFQFGLNNTFPTVFANPFRASSAGDLVPLPQMMQFGVDATLERAHPRTRGTLMDSSGKTTFDPLWGGAPWPTGYSPFNDARDAGFGNDQISFGANNAIPNSDVTQRDILPLFSERRTDAAIDTDRNPYMMYQPMSRLGNLVTDHSNVYAIWVTVGYFEVEKAPDWNSDENKVQERMGSDGSPASLVGAQALYNRVYPEGYMLGKEVGSDTGDVKRARGFYIIDRTEPVGFRPGEDLNVEKLIRLRRRIE